MKYTVFFLILLLSQFCKSKTFLTKEEIHHVKITFVNLKILTPVSVSCHSFTSYFSSKLKVIEFNDNGEWQELMKELERLSREGEKSPDDSDTRILIEFFDTNNSIIETYCVGNNIVTVGGESFIVDDHFRSFLSDLIN